MEELRRQTALNQLINTTGCPRDEALQLLESSNWQYEVSEVQAG
jgi:hypothetical protein